MLSDKSRQCSCCHSTFRIKRNPNQTYCTKTTCQNARKHQWRQKKLNQDKDYKANQKSSNQQWQSKNQNYWREYRDKNPDYAANNRSKQKLRNQRQQAIRQAAQHLPAIAKSDALEAKNPLKTGDYALVRIVRHEPDTIAKSDALIAKIVLLSRGCDNAA